MVRVRVQAQVSVSSTSQEEKDLGNQAVGFVNDAQNEGGTWQTVLDAGATDVPLQLTGVQVCRLLLVRTVPVDRTLPSSDVILRKNNIAGEAIRVRPLHSNGEGVFLLTTDSITELYASNPGTSNMKLILVVAGD